MKHWPMMLAYLYCNKFVTLQQAAEATGFTVSEAAAYYGSWHDYGMVTKYGNEPDSLVRWDGWPDPDTMKMITKGREALDAQAAVTT